MTSSRLAPSPLQAQLPAHLPTLDGLRALAIIWVVWHNVGTTGDRSVSDVVNKGFQLFLTTGWAGVQLFFVLSGFLITGILLDQHARGQNLRRFYLRRSLRIFPLYYALLAIAFILVPALGIDAPDVELAREQQGWFWSYTINWRMPFGGTGRYGHFWSLAIEEQFYFIWPIFVALLHPRRLAWACAAGIVTAIVSRYGLWFWDPELAAKTAYNFTVARIDALLMGAALALAIRSSRAIAQLERYFRLALAISLALLLAQLVVHRRWDAVGTGSELLNQTLFSAVFALGIYHCLRSEVQPRESVLHRMLTAWPMRRLARYSYAIYIFHIPLLVYVSEMGWLDMSDESGWRLLARINLHCIGILLVSTACAALSWQLLEQPCLRLRKYIK